jgi:hypothetical protein
MRRGWILLRKRGRRSRSGQVSAVATVLALMLFVSFLSTFVLGQLGNQMTQQEFQHQLQVEDQMARLQTSILEAAAAWEPGSGSLTPPVAWNKGNLCTPVAGLCASTQNNICNPPLIWNESANSTAFTVDVANSGDCVRLNVLGNHDTITVEVTGSNLGYFLLMLYGTNDTILLNSQFSASSFHASFYLYGGYDTYEAVGGPTGGHVYLSTYFVGESPTSGSCPYANLASTDSWSITGSSSGNSIQNLTWFNNIGYATAYHATSGWGALNSGTNDVLGWQNVSSPILCAFAQTSTPGEPSSTYLSSPITLSSGGSPPFGTPSSGSLQVEPRQVSATAAFSVANISAATVNWGVGSACFSTGSGTCTSGTGLEVYNFSGNHSTLSPTVAGCAVAGCRVVYNVSGSSNTLSLTLSGANIGNVLFQVSGNWDNLTVHDSGTCNLRQRLSVVFSGNNDTYTLSMTGCSTGVGANLNTTFVGSSGALCPYGNAATYDKFLGATWGSSTHIFQNFTWQNAEGIVSPAHSVAANGGNDQLTFSNTSGYYQCLFTKAVATGPYTLNYLSGVKAVLNNRYIAPSTVAYDQGAVILGVENGGSVMLSPPTTSYIQEPFGILFSLTLVSLTSVTGTATGYGTAAVISSVLSVQTYQIQDGKQGSLSLPFFFLNITTAYPQAWATFWGTQGPVDPSGTTCVPGHGVTAATCLTPPPGDTSTIIVPINASEFVLTSIVAQVSIY